MTRIAVVSACYGGYDDPPGGHAEQDVDAEWVFVTDGLTLPLAGAYDRVEVEPRPDAHPRLAAKVPKCLPWEYARGADVYVWMDASCRLLAHDALRKIASQATVSRDGLAQFRHPWRDCAYDEAEESAGLAKYRGRPVLEQAETYAEATLPKHWGLWATGLIAYDARAVPVWLDAFGRAWLAEQLRWTYQDQISQPYLLWRAGMRRPTDIRYRNGEVAPLHGSGYVEWAMHRSET